MSVATTVVHLHDGYRVRYFTPLFTINDRPEEFLDGVGCFSVSPGVQGHRRVPGGSAHSHGSLSGTLQPPFGVSGGYYSRPPLYSEPSTSAGMHPRKAVSTAFWMPIWPSEMTAGLSTSLILEQPLKLFAVKTPSNSLNKANDLFRLSKDCNYGTKTVRHNPCISNTH